MGGTSGVGAEIGDVEPFAELVEHDAGLAAEHANGTRFPQGIDLSPDHLLAPVSGGRFEAEFLRRWAGCEQHHVRVRRAHTHLIRNPTVGRHHPISHGSVPPHGT
jgi:hypothetical protein